MRVISRAALAAASTLLCAGAFAAPAAGVLPDYRPARMAVPSARYVGADGAVSVVGYNDMQELMDGWTRQFSAAYPGVRFALDLRGTRFAPAALAEERSAFAPMGGEFTPPQWAAYRQVAGTAADPVAIKVAHASVDPKSLSGPIAAFVQRDNPLAALDLGQLARAFGGQATRWGDLGAQGDWRDRPIHLVGVAPSTVIGYFVQDKVLHGGAFAASMVGVPQSAEVAERVAADPLALGYGAAMRATPGVRALALAPQAGAAAVAPTRENVAAGRYPLDRFLLIYVRPPVTPLAREFVRLALSRQGQNVVAASSLGYLPLTAAEAAVERAKLD